jgi:ketosteroid isomerase-like protein
MAATTATAAHPLLDRIARVLEAGDRAALAALYAPDAEYVAVTGSHPPAAPLRLRGAEVAAYVSGIPVEIAMTLDDALVGADGRLAFATTCRFPSGGRAVTAHLLTLDEAGRIALHRSVEAADG